MAISTGRDFRQRTCRRGRNVSFAKHSGRVDVERLEQRRLLSASTIVTTAADSGVGSLRQAILNANTNPGPDTITFNIPGSGVQTIAPASALPQITDAVSVDGTTQPGYSGTPVCKASAWSSLPMRRRVSSR